MCFDRNCKVTSFEECSPFEPCTFSWP
jgi:hypothetical protein